MARLSVLLVGLVTVFAGSMMLAHARGLEPEAGLDLGIIPALEEAESKFDEEGNKLIGIAQSALKLGDNDEKIDISSIIDRTSDSAWEFWQKLVHALGADRDDD